LIDFPVLNDKHYGTINMSEYNMLRSCSQPTILYRKSI